ncbi:MAG: hypothetical protein KJ601_04850 [Nanoarchaeota archaeon]|nr:hypothetical protein [Nanoarchaeota archaeon]MBU1705081.1 hypothetical protein [Nanoarchaeota archaeon]
MKSKGQLTIFIIFGFVILIAIGFLFYIRGATLVERAQVEEVPLEVQPVKNFVEACLEEVAVPGIYLLGEQGGYIYGYDQLLMTDNLQVAYHLEYDKDVSPTTEFMENEISRFVKRSLPLCIDNFTGFEYLGFEHGEIEVDTIIAEKDVVVKVYYPIKVIQQDSNTTISVFYANYPIRLSHILDIKDGIILISNQSDMIDLDYLSSHDVEITVLPYDKNNIVYSIHDNQSDIEEAPFIFNFAVKSDYVENLLPFVDDIKDKVAYPDALFDMQIFAYDPEGTTLHFEDNTALFNIDQTGRIGFMPTPADAGEYEIEITVSDGVNTVEKIFNLEIIEISTPVNDPPIVQYLENRIAYVNELFYMNVTAYDPEGATLAFSDNTTLFNINMTGEISFSPLFASIGEHDIEISVSDGINVVNRLLELNITQR